MTGKLRQQQQWRTTMGDNNEWVGVGVWGCLHIYLHGIQH